MANRRTLLALALPALLAACNTPSPRTIVLARGPETTAALLAAHPPEEGRNITPYLLGESQRTSRHLVWIRNREPPHMHAKHDLLVTIIRGQGTLFLSEMEIPLHEGDVAFVPAGIPHYFVNTSDTPSASFAVYSPPSDGSDVVPVK